MDFHKVKTRQSSPTYEKLNRERLEQARLIKQCAKQNIDRAHELIAQTSELLRRVRSRKAKR